AGPRSGKNPRAFRIVLPVILIAPRQWRRVKPSQRAAGPAMACNSPSASHNPRPRAHHQRRARESERTPHSRTQGTPVQRHPDYTRTRVKQLAERMKLKIYAQTRAAEQVLISERVDRVGYDEAMKLKKWRAAKIG